ncbi:MAG: amidophosphoribosyltransferase [Saprospiraceae bacterium]|nr:amidophosphoribosyltransferase [Saprospiraceae bacterium]HMW38770.1 amidophosphoribosyltransferase [Saprospiraceae bacterium]HMX88691.1 amidophosphoribosyltransferase [Saprospiraceae bacterium]HMZ40123.1 amidophosphoribosyltransferase [Saprospiraceae bacterium]HNE62387.1 amidophosphoribosyltransferase [Saprospiraceae bacterium]
MSDQIKHECGLAFIRLLKPLAYYQEKYGTSFYGLQKLQLLLQKQRNRGQDGAGLATIKLDVRPGEKYFSVHKSNANNYISHLFEGVYAHFKDLDKDQLQNTQWLKKNKPFTGEVLLGHLRYGTHGDNSLETVHPFVRENNWISRNLAVAGNFNMTNVDELFDKLVSLGQYPKIKSDTITVLEKIGHFLDEEVQHLFNWYKPEGYSQMQINPLIFDHLDISRVLKKAARKFDGGYVIAGLIGHGDAFILRDPGGIRPAFYYQDEEVVVMASERPAIQTAFGVRRTDIQEVKPGNALIIKHNGKISEELCLEPGPKLSCSFERIYFSRGNDYDIYQERKNLGRFLVPDIMEAVDHDFENTVFSYIPNTSESAFFGMMEAVTDELNKQKLVRVRELSPKDDSAALQVLQLRPRFEKLVLKDDKMRTFIANDLIRGGMVSHIYDVTYGIVRNDKDTLVVVDDSIVRGTTLRDSIIRILCTLKPRQVIVVSSAPQIRYPDCYGIDMSQIDKLVAFRAMIDLLHEHNLEHLMEEVYHRCLEQRDAAPAQMKNYVRELYDHFSYEEISSRISKLLTPPETKIPVKIIFQTLEGLHRACPDHRGDWYFSGDYPTPGGFRVLNNAYINFMEKKDVRAY